MPQERPPGAIPTHVYDPATQIAPSQIEVISSVVLGRGAACRFLVFGVGHDTPYWHWLNRGGATLFVEGSPEFQAAAASATPDAQILGFDFARHTSVFGSMRLTLAELDAVPPPAQLLAADWDVILIDGPAGYHMTDPGRALPIRWASRLMDRRTHIFVDDYHRAVERHFTDLLIRYDNPPCALLAHEAEAGKSMLWRIGRSLGEG